MWKLFGILGMLFCLEGVAGGKGKGAQDIPSSGVRRNVREVDLMGHFSIRNETYKNTRFGGISGLVFNPNRGVYYALSNDPKEPRFYTIEMKVNKKFRRRDIDIEAVTFLKTAKGDRFPPGDLDPEGIAYRNGRIFISSEGNVDKRIDPAIIEFNHSGYEQFRFALPEYYYPGGNQGARHNSSLKALTISPDGKWLWTGLESPLEQDGDPSTPTSESYSRMLKFDRRSGLPFDEFVYVNERVHATPVPTSGERLNGLVELIALDDDGTFLALERSYAQGKGFKSSLYEVLTQGALDVRDYKQLAENGVRYGIDFPVTKEHEADLDDNDLDIPAANYEAMAVQVEKGRQFKMVLISNNNNDDRVATHFVALEMKIRSDIGLAEPEEETTDVFRDKNTDGNLQLKGEASDPAIWVHPDEPDQSLVIAALTNGGIGTFDLSGQLFQVIPPGSLFDEIAQVGIVYAFPFNDGADLVDIVVASDTSKDNLVIWKIARETRRLESGTTITGIFSDDNTGNVYALATYTSPFDGINSVFVGQSMGNLLRRVELAANGQNVQKGEVFTKTIRNKDGEHVADDIVVTGLTVDREFGNIYIITESMEGVLRTDAEPNKNDDEFLLVENDGDPKIEDKLKGVTIYYGGDHFGEGYVIVSNEGDSSFLVYERDGDNDYVGSFAVTYDDGVDQASRSDGIDVLNVDLGPEFPCGLFVAQDTFNENQELKLDTTANPGLLDNTNSNFKLVPWDEIAETFSKELDMNTKGWVPRRFALVVRIDYISSDIFSSFLLGEVSGRDAERFLYDLDEAAYQLYKPGTKRRRMFSPIGRSTFPKGNGKGNGKGNRRRRSTREIPHGARGFSGTKEIHMTSDFNELSRRLGGNQCRGKGKKGRNKNYGSDYDDIKDSLEAFIGGVQECIDAGTVDTSLANSWIDAIQAIIDQLPDKSFTPSPTPVQKTRAPTPAPTSKPTNAPTPLPTRSPTPRPTRKPTPAPTVARVAVTPSKSPAIDENLV
jgi:myo-inositol-hexaphosphate 3-phosphohydrolase